MRMEDFIKEWDVNANRREILNGHITRFYVPYAEKVARCGMIIENSMYVTDDETGVRIFKSNTPLMAQQFTMTLFSMYTDIECDDWLKGYDLLTERGVPETLFASIGKDCDRFRRVLRETRGDARFNETNTALWLDRKLEAVKIIMDEVLPEMIKMEVTDEEEIHEREGTGE